MKVFIGFGYNENDRWIKELVIPFVQTLGCEIETGEDMQGEDLADGVITRITDSDACIGFLTKRGNANSDGIYATHKWVIEELTLALGQKKSIFELREKNVDPQKGLTGKLQKYEFEDKSYLLMEIAKFIMKEKVKLTNKIFMLLPNELINEMKPHIDYIKCTYNFMYKTKFYDPEEANIVRFSGGYGIIIKKIPNEEALIEIKISGPDQINWSSGFVSVGLMNVHLQKDN